MTDDTTAQARAGDGLDLAYLTELLADATRTPISTRVHIGSGKAPDTVSLVGLRPSDATAFWAIWTAAPALIAAARERDELREQLEVWKSVFPDIAPDSVIRNRSIVEDENVSLRALLAKAEEALEFYATTGSYDPHPHGIAFDRRDKSSTAKRVLSEIRKAMTP